MKQLTNHWVPVIALMLCGACIGPRLGTPDQVARDVIAAADEGRSEEATRIVEAAASRSDLRDLVFPQLYTAAQDRFEGDNPRGAAGILRALAAGYEDALSVRIGLAYSLFLLRAETVDPAPEEVAELASMLDQIDARATSPPAWVHLARAQNSIDRGDLEAAREAVSGFRQEWDGEPNSLAPYVDDLDRYLSSH